uniref:F-box domain-containing protein n=1 Tax=Mycena chlorophos TaxID=658473 RepID=A0ABQ0L6H0_MYCCL|nr:predicted protein [Mycena chlorophos]
MEARLMFDMVRWSVTPTVASCCLCPGFHHLPSIHPPLSDDWLPSEAATTTTPIRLRDDTTTLIPSSASSWANRSSQLFSQKVSNATLSLLHRTIESIDLQALISCCAVLRRIGLGSQPSPARTLVSRSRRRRPGKVFFAASIIGSAAAAAQPRVLSERNLTCLKVLMRCASKRVGEKRRGNLAPKMYLKMCYTDLFSALAVMPLVL